MEVFDVFNELENENEIEIDEMSDIESSIDEDESCKHKEISNDNGIVSCLNCGMEV